MKMATYRSLKKVRDRRHAALTFIGFATAAVFTSVLFLLKDPPITVQSCSNIAERVAKHEACYYSDGTCRLSPPEEAKMWELRGELFACRDREREGTEILWRN